MQRVSIVRRSKYLLAPAGRKTRLTRKMGGAKNGNNRTHVRRKTSIACFLTCFHMCTGHGSERTIQKESNRKQKRMMRW